MAPALSTTKGEKGEGDAGFLSWQNNLRSLPFLRRNLRKVFQTLVESADRAKAQSSLRMGSILSRPKISRAREPSDGEDDEPPRPAKRQRTSLHDKNLTSQNGSSLQRVVTPPGPDAIGGLVPNGGLPQHIPLKNAPLNRRTAALKEKKAFRIDSILPMVPERSLRINVLGIKFDDSSTVEVSRAKSGQTFKCRCTVGLFTTENENSPEFTEVCRATQTGTIRTVFENGKSGAQVILPEPFHIKAEDLYVNKQGETCLSDQYRLHVWLKPRGSQQSWPPLNTRQLVDSTKLANILDDAGANLNNLWLFCTTRYLLDPDGQADPLELCLVYGTHTMKSEKVATPYALDLAITWSLPSSLSISKAKSSKLDLIRKSNSANPVEPLTVATDQENVLVVANESPRRAQRRRTEGTTYNLKVLSDRARGDPPKLNRPRESRSVQRVSEQDDDLSVIYTLGRANAADFGIEQKTILSGFTCVICRNDHSSLEKLRLHFRSQHSRFTFHLRRSQPPRIQFFVEFSGRFRGIPPTRTIQISKPRTLFDLSKFIDGDRSWEKARQGPQHNLLSKHLADRFPLSSPSFSPSVSRQSSPNTSLDISEEFPESSEPKPAAALRFNRPTRMRVPETAEQLYHPVTKRPLIAGEEIDNSDDEYDEGWLNQKHRDIIMDYTNITDTEKDYIIRWNPYITNLKLTCDKFMPQVIVRFVAENTLWFLADDNRPKEFCKHAEALILRGTIDFECWQECMEILKRAEKRTSKEQVEKAQKAEMPTWDPSKQRGFMDCICGLPVNSIDTLNRILCSGAKCRDPYFHPQCVKEAVIDEKGNITNCDEVDNWKCDSCKASNDEGGVPMYAGSFFTD